MCQVCVMMGRLYERQLEMERQAWFTQGDINHALAANATNAPKPGTELASSGKSTKQ